MNAGSSGESREGPADLANGRVHAGVDVDEDVLAPQPVDDVVARHQLTSPLDEHDQEVHRLPFEPNRTAAATQFVSRDVQLEVAEAERLTLGWTSASRAHFVTCRQGSPLRYLERQEINRISPAVLHGQPARQRSA